MNIAELAAWSQIKGATVVGTGDFTHPLWFEEVREKLEPAEPGLFKLKGAIEKKIEQNVPAKCRAPMRYFLSVEISTIYKKNDRVRKVHSLVFAPVFAAASKINAALGKIGNINSDGRPILGLDTKELLKIVLDASPDCMLVPAHIWTPHFSVYGSQSGFDSLEECFDELAPRIYAIETGLSSDPAMNWRIPELDTRAIISNSDAHSPEKLGREANLFNTELSYFAIMDALKKNDPRAFLGTIEFYPEEGKYHLDGHRNCKTRLHPKETIKRKGLCPVCGRRATIGVMHRVETLAKRPEGFDPKKRPPFKSIVPLPEILAEVLGVSGSGSKKVRELHMKMIHDLGNEFTILLDAPLEDIARSAGEITAEAVKRMRKGAITILGGYDGEYGTVRIFSDKDRTKFASPPKSQKPLF
ncbi:endonuclease Q family protein [bacterium]|nr:endonuclease Q family protein [bacterium]MCI0566249.1 endonuclease Q family protein [bacterium]